MVDPSDFGSDSSDGSGSSLPTSDIEPNNPRSTNTGTPHSWVTKLDFSKPHVIVAEDKPGDIIVSRADLIVMKEADDWRRLDENPNREVHVLATWDSRAHWSSFRALAQDQYDEDPNELLQDDIERLIELDEEVHWPPGSKPSKTRTCRVCGDTLDMDEVELVELDLHYTRKVDVCPDHSVEELAENGLLS